MTFLEKIEKIGNISEKQLEPSIRDDERPEIEKEDVPGRIFF